MEDTEYCVYIHISSVGDIFYVGQGREYRAKRKDTGRAKEWDDFAKDGWEYLILHDNLTKDEAVALEKETTLRLIEVGEPLVNKSIHNGVRTLTREMFEDGANNKEVAEVVGLHDRYVSLVRHGKRWRQLYDKVGKVFPESYTEDVVTDEMLIEAVQMINNGFRNTDIANKTGIERSTVSRLRYGKLFVNRLSILELSIT